MHKKGTTFFVKPAAKEEIHLRWVGVRSIRQDVWRVRLREGADQTRLGMHRQQHLPAPLQGNIHHSSGGLASGYLQVNRKHILRTQSRRVSTREHHTNVSEYLALFKRVFGFAWLSGSHLVLSGYRGIWYFSDGAGFELKLTALEAYALYRSTPHLLWP